MCWSESKWNDQLNFYLELANVIAKSTSLKQIIVGPSNKKFNLVITEDYVFLENAAYSNDQSEILNEIDNS